MKPNPLPPSAELSGTIEGRFVIRNLLGAGGMGEVYRAEDTRLKRLVALKRIAPAIRKNESNRRRLWQEAECASRLNDSHIAAVFDIFESGEDIFLVMEYVEGQTLRRTPAATVPPNTPARSKWVLRAAVGIPTVVVIVVLATLATIPTAREQVKSWLRISGIPKQKQLAVLEFQVVDGSPEETAFTAGLTDTVTTKLTELTADRSLLVVPARDLRERHVTTSEQALRDFGVNFVLEGSLYKSGDFVRVNYALVDARSRRQLRAQSVTLAASDPFALQDQIVDGAVDMLQLQIPPAEREAIRPHGTQVPGAYTLYLQGKGYLEDYDKPDNLDTAVNLFQQALQLDPSYALAYASLGDAYWKKYVHTKDVRLIESTQAPCEQALHLNEKLSAAHECLGTVAAGTGHYEEAVLEFERAIDSDPANNDAYVGLAHAYELLGKPAEAENTYRRAIDLRPQYWGGYNSLGAFYFRQAQYPRAAEMFSKVVALAPDSFHGYDNLGAAYLGQGQYPEAIETFKHSISLRPTAYAYTNIGTAYFYMHQFDDAANNDEQALKLGGGDFELWWNLGDALYWNPAKKSQAEHAYRQCISLGTPELDVDSRNVYAMGILAVCHAMLNDRQGALELLQKAFALGPRDADLSFKAAIVYTQLQQEDQAVERLGEAIASGYSAKLASDTPIFDQYRSSPRVQELFRSR